MIAALQPALPERIVLGPILDLSRFVRGRLSPPPTTRRLAQADLAMAQATLTGAGCDLSRCTETNLHTASVPLPPARLYTQMLTWEAWPCSAFFACPTTTMAGVGRFSYRLYGMLPIVMMQLHLANGVDTIIYRILHGIGAGGFHAFLLRQATARATVVSIFTTFPPSPLFFEGLHDQMNFDIYRQLYQFAVTSG